MGFKCGLYYRAGLCFSHNEKEYSRWCTSGTWSAWVERNYTNTWRGIQNNLTSDSATDSLSAAQGKALKALVDSKASSGHTHSYAGSSSVGGAATSADKSIPMQEVLHSRYISRMASPRRPHTPSQSPYLHRPCLLIHGKRWLVHQQVPQEQRGTLLHLQKVRQIAIYDVTERGLYRRTR